MQRIDGFLDLDSFFIENYELCKIKHLLDEEIIKEIDDKFYWFDIGDSKYMFKECYTIEECYIEVISMKMLQRIGYNCAFYDLAKFNNMDGVITKDFKEDGHTYISGATLIDEYYPSEKKINQYDIIHELREKIKKHNNLEDIWNILEKRYNKYPNKREIVENIMTEMAKRFLFYIITKQWDNSAQNWIIDEFGLDVKLTPIFDNQKMLGLSTDKNKPVSLKVDEYNKNGNIIELKKMLNYSNIEIYNEFKRIYEILNPEELNKIIIEIEKETNNKINKQIKTRIKDAYKKNYEDLSIIFEEELSIKR